MRLLTTILGWLGMRRDVPPAVLDVAHPTPALPLYEAVNLDPSAFPELVLRPGWQLLNESNPGTILPHGKAV